MVNAKSRGPFTPSNELVPTVQEAGWAPARGCMGAKNIVLTGIRSLDCPVNSKSLYHLGNASPLCYVTEHSKHACREASSQKCLGTLHNCDLYLQIFQRIVVPSSAR
jgi:hypothetical protein